MHLKAWRYFHSYLACCQWWLLVYRLSNSITSSKQSRLLILWHLRHSTHIFTSTISSFIPYLLCLIGLFKLSIKEEEICLLETSLRCGCASFSELLYLIMSCGLSFGLSAHEFTDQRGTWLMDSFKHASNHGYLLFCLLAIFILGITYIQDALLKPFLFKLISKYLFLSRFLQWLLSKDLA